ncbi:MAG: hypothetical protein ABF443_12600 [Acetobacter malorum]|uniref:hypothetical protein n=1 Tax=Acetobacter malorum TaxID=178901 RepID=UPI0039E7EF04
MVNRYHSNSAEGLATAKSVFQTRYEAASFAYVVGLIMRGEGTYVSDIGIVVIYDHLEAACRKSFIVGDMPIKAFVHNYETLAWFVKEDVLRCRPSILNMTAEGRIIGREHDRAEALRREMSDFLAKGPPPLSPTALNALRYELIVRARGRRTCSAK